MDAAAIEKPGLKSKNQMTGPVKPCSVFVQFYG
jgi:hypothetical protein